MKTTIKRSKGDAIFDTLNYTFLIILLLIIIYPLYFVIIASISDPQLVNTGKVIAWPRGLNFDGYRRIFSYDAVWVGYRNTIIYTVMGTLFNLFLTLTIAYTLSRKKFFGKNIMMAYIMFTMYFSGGLIPTYLLVKDINLLDKWYTLILLGGVSAFNIIVAKSFIQGSIPEELFESASIDGCTHFIFFTKIVLPLSKPILAVLALFYGVGHWNEFMVALIYINNKQLLPLQLILRNILIQGESMALNMANADPDEALKLLRESELLKYGLIIVASVPLLVVYPLLQKYFAQGTMIGSVKG